MTTKTVQGEITYFIFDLEKHANYIDDFLLKASKAHGHAVKSKAWFEWKFFKSPFGNTILACAATADELVGCVGYGRQPFLHNGQEHSGVLSFETFVDPNFQGQGIFSKLLKYAEEQVLASDIKIMLNFPNSNSLPGFLKKQWQQLDINCYYLKPKISLSLLKNIKDIKKPFIPLANNFDTLKHQVPKTFKQHPKNKLEAKITLDYIKYRFFSHPNGHYKVYNTAGDFAIARLGKRGNLLELQILYVNFNTISGGRFKKIIKQMSSGLAVNLVSYPTSSHSVLTTILKSQFFIKVPSSTNICYKFLTPNSNINMNTLELSAINFHTY